MIYGGSGSAGVSGFYIRWPAQGINPALPGAGRTQAGGDPLPDFYDLVYGMKKISEKTTQEILSGNLVKAILSLAVPVMINSFLQTMYNLTDTYWLGQLGTSELAGINLISPVQSIVVNFGSGLTVAGSVLIARYVGAKKTEDAKSMANQIFASAMIFSLTCATLIFLLSPLIVKALGAEGDVAKVAETYLKLVILDMPFLYTVNMFQSVNQAQGDTVRPMLLNLLGICINMVADPLLMVVLKLGAAGAALATVFAKMIPAVIAFILLNNKKRAVYLDLRNLHFERKKIRDIITIGLPSAIGGSVTQFAFLLLTKSVLEYGEEAMAAYGVGNKINGLISLPSNGIGSAVATIVSQNMGAGQEKRARKAYKMAMSGIVIFLLVGGFILSRIPVSTGIVKIFTDDPEVIVMGARYLSILAFWCFFNGVHNSTMGFFQGCGHTEVTMAVDVLRLWVFRFATLFVCQKILHLGVESIWYCVVVSNALAPIVLVIVYLTGYWKRKRI